MQNGFNVPVGTFLCGLPIAFWSACEPRMFQLEHWLVPSFDPDRICKQTIVPLGTFSRIWTRKLLTRKIWTRKTGPPGKSWLRRSSGHEICGYSPTFNRFRWIHIDVSLLQQLSLPPVNIMVRLFQSPLFQSAAGAIQTLESDSHHSNETYSEPIWLTEPAWMRSAKPIARMAEPGLRPPLKHR